MMATFCHHDGPPAPHDGNASPFRGGAAPQWRQRLVIMAARARRAAHHGGSVLPSRAGRGPLRRPAGRQPFGQPDGLRRIHWAARVGPPSRASHAAGWVGGGRSRNPLAAPPGGTRRDARAPGPGRARKTCMRRRAFNRCRSAWHHDANIRAARGHHDGRALPCHCDGNALPSWKRERAAPPPRCGHDGNVVPSWWLGGSS